MFPKYVFSPDAFPYSFAYSFSPLGTELQVKSCYSADLLFPECLSQWRMKRLDLRLLRIRFLFEQPNNCAWTVYTGHIYNEFSTDSSFSWVKERLHEVNPKQARKPGSYAGSNLCPPTL